MDFESEKSPTLRNLDEIPAGFLSLLAANRKISTVFEERRDLEAELRSFHPFMSAALVAGLLTQPSLQANTLRIELLIHLLVAFSMGSRVPSRREIARLLNSELAATAFTLMEDPPEDVFLSNVTTSEGNFRVFEGLWESSDFYLQRVVNVVDTFSADCRHLKREVLAILKLSEEIAARRGLDRFSPGHGSDKQEIYLPTLQRMESLRRAITFSPADLERLEIRPTDLAPFIFPPYRRMQLGARPLGDTELEWRPIIQDNAQWSILLPTAISIAVRQRIFSWMVEHGYQDRFDRFYLREYRQFLASTPILGSSIPRDMTVPSKQIANSTILEILREFDAGRFLQVIAIVTGLASFSKHRFLPDEDGSEFSEQIQKAVTSARAEFRKEEGFKQGLTLLVWCGYGQPGTCGLPEETQDWKIEAVSAPDLEILGSTSPASPLFLWKLIDHERFLAHHNVLISNANGLLNLYGWWRRTGYKMLDEEMEFGGGRSLNLMIPTDCLAEVRKKIRLGWDVHSLPLPDGKMLRVIRKTFDSYFPEDAGKPNYGCIDAAVAGKLFGAFVGERLVWWVAADPAESTLSLDLVFQVWDAVSNWLERAVPLFERETPTLVAKAVLIVLDFSQTHQMHGERISEDILRSCLSVTVNSEAKTVQIGFRDPFFAGFGLTKNSAERTIVRAVAEGVLRTAGRVADEQLLELIVREIIPNDDARHVHFFQGAHFRDHIREYDRPKSLLIDDADIARSRLGLGWLVRNPAEGDHFATVEESVRFLNEVVEAIWQRIRLRLEKLDRVSLIEEAFRHIEGVEADKMQWDRTIRAVVALRKDEPGTRSVAVQQIARFNSATLSLRLLVEMALSTCPLERGQSVGVLDLNPLMADVLGMFHLGGWSDAIMKAVMQPEMRIAADGEIFSHVGFRDEVVEPFGLEFASVQLEHEVDRYEKHFEPVRALPSVRGIFPEEFLTAVEAEFGVSVDAIRGFRDAVESFALENKKSVFIARKNEILSFCGKSEVSKAEIAEVVLNRFELWPRASWDNTPKGFKQKDWYPWRFGRRLSLIRRPLVRLEDGKNPRYVVSPGLIGTNVVHALRLYHEGLVPIDQCETVVMKRWVAKEVNRRGHAFARKVFETMRSVNYQALLESKVSSLLDEKLTRDFGDVDVLAWRVADRIVLVIECKDLRLAKTPNEIAEQLNQFTGQVLANGERDDLLKHIDRCNLLEQRSQVLAEKIGMRGQDIKVRNIVCFSHPVPMQYVKTRLPEVSFMTLQELESARFW